MKTKLITQKVIDLLNLRIKQEEESSRLYEQISMWLNDMGYLNLSKLYKKYADEELTHAGWSKTYLLDYGLTPELSALEKPKNNFKSIKEILELTLVHEEFVTSEITKIGQEALSEPDYVLFSLVNKYQAEQQEEIGKSITNLDILALTSDDLVLDQYIGENIL